MLLEHGTVQAVEAEIEKYHSKEEKNKLKGGTHTEASLKAMGWTEQLGCN